MIRFYTNLEQSRALAKILSPNSADMCWFEGQPFVETVTGYEEDRAEAHRQAGMEMYPCWSLVSLLEALPGCSLDSSEGHQSFRVHHRKMFTEWYDCPVDAAYEMILKLNKLNLL